jgi:hypothetical protein
VGTLTRRPTSSHGAADTGRERRGRGRRYVLKDALVEVGACSDAVDVESRVAAVAANWGCGRQHVAGATREW